MKIFNWVHRKFHQNADNYLVCPKKDGLAPEEKKLETDTDALLEHVKFVEMIDGWKDGILTIGTFGFDPLNLPPYEQNEYCVDTIDEEISRGGEEHSVTNEEEKVNPMVISAFKQEFQKVLGSNLDTNIGNHRLSTTVDDVPLLQFLESPQIKSEIEIEIKKKRTTLAELFSADSNNVVTEKSDPSEKLPDLVKIPVCRKNNSLSFAKKFMPSKGDDSRTIKKIHRLVTKMLKKKIHPDLEGRTNNHGKEKSTKDESKSEQMVEAKSENGTIEKISLLRDAVAQL